MSDLAVSWVAVAPSAWQRLLRCVALTLTAGSLGAAAFIHVSGSALITAGASAGVMLVVAGFAWMRQPAPDDRAWSVGSDGRVSVRSGDQIYRDAAVVFTSAVFIVLRANGRAIEVWRDATPLRAFRRLSVAARWRTPRSGSPLLTAINRADASERT